MSEHPVDPRELDLATLAALVGAAANEHLLAAIRARGHDRLRISHGFVVQHLVEGSPSVTDLAELMGVTQQAASKVVAELETLGYVERVLDAVDGRVRRVRLTGRGLQVVQVARDERRRLNQALAHAVGAESLDGARQVLLALLDRVGGGDAIAQRRVKPHV